MSIAGDCARTFATQVALLGAQMLTGMMATRMLGAEGYGTLAFVVTTATLAATMAQLGIVYSLMQQRSQPVWTLRGAARTLSMAALSLGVVAMAITAVLVAVPLPGRVLPPIAAGLLVPGAILAACLLVSQLFEVFLRLCSAISTSNLARLVPRLLLVGVLGVWAAPWLWGRPVLEWPKALAEVGMSPGAYLWLNVGVLGLGAAWMLAAAWSFGRGEPTAQTPPPMLRALVCGGLVAWPLYLLLFLLNRLDVFVVASLFGSEPLGWYAVASALAELASYAGFAINAAVLSLAAGHNEHQAMDAVQRSLRFNLLLGGLSAVLLAAVAPWAVAIYAGRAYQPSTLPMLLLLPGVMAQFAFGICSAVVARRGWFGQATLLLALALALQAALASMLAPHHGLAGVAAARSASWLLVLGAHAVWFHRMALIPLSAWWRFDATDARLLQRRLLLWRQAAA